MFEEEVLMKVNGTDCSIGAKTMMDRVCDDIVRISGSVDGRNIVVEFSPEEWDALMRACGGSEPKLASTLLDYIGEALQRAGHTPDMHGVHACGETRMFDTF